MISSTFVSLAVAAMALNAVAAPAGKVGQGQNNNEGLTSTPGVVEGFTPGIDTALPSATEKVSGAKTTGRPRNSGRPKDPSQPLSSHGPKPTSTVHHDHPKMEQHCDENGHGKDDDECDDEDNEDDDEANCEEQGHSSAPVHETPHSKNTPAHSNASSGLPKPTPPSGPPPKKKEGSQEIKARAPTDPTPPDSGPRSGFASPPIVKGQPTPSSNHPGGGQEHQSGTESSPSKPTGSGKPGKPKCGKGKKGHGHGHGGDRQGQGGKKCHKHKGPKKHSSIALSTAPGPIKTESPKDHSGKHNGLHQGSKIASLD